MPGDFTVFLCRPRYPFGASQVTEPYTGNPACPSICAIEKENRCVFVQLAISRSMAVLPTPGGPDSTMGFCINLGVFPSSYVLSALFLKAGDSRGANEHGLERAEIARLLAEFFQ